MPLVTSQERVNASTPRTSSPRHSGDRLLLLRADLLDDRLLSPECYLLRARRLVLPFDDVQLLFQKHLFLGDYPLLQKRYDHHVALHADRRRRPIDHAVDGNPLHFNVLAEDGLFDQLTPFVDDLRDPHLAGLDPLTADLELLLHDRDHQRALFGSDRPGRRLRCGGAAGALVTAGRVRFPGGLPSRPVKFGEGPLEDVSAAEHFPTQKLTWYRDLSALIKVHGYFTRQPDLRFRVGHRARHSFAVFDHDEVRHVRPCRIFFPGHNDYPHQAPGADSSRRRPGLLSYEPPCGQSGAQPRARLLALPRTRSHAYRTESLTSSQAPCPRDSQSPRAPDSTSDQSLAEP